MTSAAAPTAREFESTVADQDGDDMQALRFLFSPAGRLRPQPFVMAAIAIYLAFAASQFLTTPTVIIHGAFWPFAAVNVVLLWIWCVVHAKRLRDAGRPIGVAVGAGVLYALSLVLLLLLVSFAFVDTPAASATDLNATGALAVVLLLSVIAVSLGSAQQHDLAWLLTAVFAVMAFLPVIVAIAVTLWAGTRPSVASSAA
jgi:uncharacterized membrane protein YhaH (DUF805 family)